jgi:hypothetical protein
MTDDNLYHRGVQLDNLDAGDIVTVLRWAPREVVETDGLDIMTRLIEDYAYCGELLRVVAVSPPYLAVEEVVARCGHQHRAVIDARRCVLTLPNEDYIQALLSPAKSEWLRVSPDPEQ